MTVVVAVRGPESIVVAADKQSTWGNAKTYGIRPKFVAVEVEGHQIVIAGAGDPAIIEYVRSLEELPKPLSEGDLGEQWVYELSRTVTKGCADLPLPPSDEGMLDGSLMVVTHRGIYLTATNYAERQLGIAQAIGSGANFAIGHVSGVTGSWHDDAVAVQDPEAVAIGAVLTACAHDAGCSIPDGDTPDIIEIPLRMMSEEAA